MPRKALLAVLLLAVAASGCKSMERLTFIRPSATRGEYTQVAPTYDVSGKKARAGTMDAGRLVQSAGEAFRTGDLVRAHDLAKRALRADPRSGDAHTLLASVAGARGDRAVAGEHFGQAAALAPRNGVYANNYGVWLCGNGRAVESLDWFDVALADPAYPTRAAALANAGNCAHRGGQLARAEGYLRAALALDPQNAVALAAMAQLQYDAGRYLEARAFSERRLAAAPHDAASLQLASQIEQKLGDEAAALRYLHASQALSPDNPTIPRIP